MYPVTLREFQLLTNCRFLGDVDPQRQLTGVQIDSRKIVAGDVFVALPGASCHGLHFAQAASDAGACAVLTSETEFENTRTSQSVELAECAIAVVPDAVAALQTFAAWNRRQSSAHVIAVTGSVGKTTTRGLIASVLRQAAPTVESPQNYNNHLGVPLTLLQLAPEHHFAVVEVGSSAPGEIARLAALVQPTDAVITRIAAAHLKDLKSIDAVAGEKLSLLEFVAAGGTAWLNGDDTHLQAAARRLSKFKGAPCLDVRLVSAKDTIESWTDANSPRLSLSVNGTRFTAPLAGHHHAFALRTAIGIGWHFGMTDEQIQAGFDGYRPQPGRCRVIETNFGCIIDDTYNASPASVEAAIELLSDWPNAGRRVLVLGDMLDLGEHSEEFHARIGTEICNSKIDQVWLTGAATKTTADVVKHFQGRDIAVNWHATARDIGNELRRLLVSSADNPSSNDTTGVDRHTVVLVKGSRGMQMELVVELISRNKSM